MVESPNCCYDEKPWSTMTLYTMSDDDNYVKANRTKDLFKTRVLKSLPFGGLMKRPKTKVTEACLLLHV